MKLIKKMQQGGFLTYEPIQSPQPQQQRSSSSKKTKKDEKEDAPVIGLDPAIWKKIDAGALSSDTQELQSETVNLQNQFSNMSDLEKSTDKGRLILQKINNQFADIVTIKNNKEAYTTAIKEMESRNTQNETAITADGKFILKHPQTGAISLVTQSQMNELVRSNKLQEKGMPITVAEAAHLRRNIYSGNQLKGAFGNDIFTNAISSTNSSSIIGDYFKDSLSKIGNTEVKGSNATVKQVLGLDGNGGSSNQQQVESAMGMLLRTMPADVKAQITKDASMKGVYAPQQNIMDLAKGYMGQYLSQNIDKTPVKDPSKSSTSDAKIGKWQAHYQGEDNSPLSLKLTSIGTEGGYKTIVLAKATPADFLISGNEPSTRLSQTDLFSTMGVGDVTLSDGSKVDPNELAVKREVTHYINNFPATVDGEPDVKLMDKVGKIGKMIEEQEQRIGEPLPPEKKAQMYAQEGVGYDPVTDSPVYQRTVPVQAVNVMVSDHTNKNLEFDTSYYEGVGKAELGLYKNAMSGGKDTKKWGEDNDYDDPWAFGMFGDNTYKTVAYIKLDPNKAIMADNNEYRGNVASSRSNAYIVNERNNTNKERVNGVNLSGNDL